MPSFGRLPEATRSAGGDSLGPTRIARDGPLRGSGNGRFNGQPQGLAPEPQLNITSQAARPEDARQNAQIRGRGTTLIHCAGPRPAFLPAFTGRAPCAGSELLQAQAKGHI